MQIDEHGFRYACVLKHDYTFLHVCVFVPHSTLTVCGPYVWMLLTVQKKTKNLSPCSQLDNKHRMAWQDSKIIYLAPLLLSSMVFVESEETICCPVIMGGQGGGDWKQGEQIKLRENDRRCPRTSSTFLPTCSKSAILINIPSDICCLCVCVCTACVSSVYVSVCVYFPSNLDHFRVRIVPEPG